MRRSSYRRRGFIVLLLALAAYVTTHFEVATDITAFMPNGGDPKITQLTRYMANSELSRTMVLMIGAQDEHTALAAGRDFEHALRHTPAVRDGLAHLDGGPQEGTEQAIYELYHPRRFGFVGFTKNEVERKLSAKGQERAAADLKTRLSQPMAPLVSRLAPSDPLLTIAHLFERLQSSHGRSLSVSDGRFITPDGKHSVLFLSTRAGAFDSNAQRPLVAGVATAFAQVNVEYDGKLTLEQSATNRIAVHTEQAIKNDIERVTLVSTLCLAIILGGLFRSLRLVALACIPIGCGVLVGLASCLLFYGHVHGITLAFGASLIGVAIDYVVHLYCHHAVAPASDGPRGTLRMIAPALRTGAATTLVGFAALALAGFPGLQEVSLFASTGVLAALVATQLFLPELLPTQIGEVALRSGLVLWLGQALRALQKQRSRLLLLPAAAVVLCALAVPDVHIDDNLLALGQIQGPMADEDQRVRNRVARFDQTRFIVASGSTEEAALQANDRVAIVLQEAQEDGELQSYRNVAAMLPSARRQRTIDATARRALGDGTALLKNFASAGFVPSAFAPFSDGLSEPSPSPLTYQALLDSPMAPAVRSFRFSAGDDVAFVSFLNQVHDPHALTQRLEGLAGVSFVDQGTQMRRTFSDYQERTAWLIAIGLFGVLLLLAVRYRNASKVLAAFGPSLLAAIVTVSALGSWGYGLNLVSLTALLMVVSMGVDYGVFLVDADDSGHGPAALLSIVMAAASTIGGFGLLALSSHPMLASIGITASVGVLSCVILAPTALVLSRPQTWTTGHEEGT